MTVYLDYNATTPVDPRVADAVMEAMTQHFGNAGSRSHVFGQRAKEAVRAARKRVGDVVDADPDEVIFTSGATEANNLAILGLQGHGESLRKQHIISTAIEHKAVLEPLEVLSNRGWDVDLVPPNQDGWIEPKQVERRLRDDTLLVSVMHVNNETGIRQPIDEIASLLGDHLSYFHVDAAQGFGKSLPELRSRRIDLISISGHKIFAPQGVGALIVRRRGFDSVPLSPLQHGGGQERGLRPGTLPVPLIVGLGLASEIAVREHEQRAQAVSNFRKEALTYLIPLGGVVNGDPSRAMPHVLSISFPGVDSEALMVALKELVAVSNGSACTSRSYSPSHVLKAMGLAQDAVEGTIRMSWSHDTPAANWEPISEVIRSLVGVDAPT